MAVGRVAGRVALGGHDIPEDVIRRRYGLGLRNLFSLYLPLATSWEIRDQEIARLIEDLTRDETPVAPQAA
jgi:predicted ABC-type ATPase